MKPETIGHRKRLKNKFLEENGSGIADYEFLEMLLFLSIPRIDTKSISKELLKKFKNLNNVIYADSNELKKIDYISDNTVYLFKLIQEAIKRIFNTAFEGKNILSSYQEVIKYCQVIIGNSKIEEFHILFLDIKNQLIKHELSQKGTIDRSAIYSREVIKQALELGASSIILIHNHPSGDPEPSNNDIIITKSISEAGKVLGITVLDHIIISRYQYRSLKSMGIL